jgi:hypothetical protein
MSKTFKVEFPNGEIIELTHTEESAKIVEEIGQNQFLAEVGEELEEIGEFGSLLLGRTMAETAEKALERVLKRLGK